MMFTVNASVGGHIVAHGYATSLETAMEEFKEKLAKHLEFLDSEARSGLEALEVAA